MSDRISPGRIVSLKDFCRLLAMSDSDRGSSDAEASALAEDEDGSSWADLPQ